MAVMTAIVNIYIAIRMSLLVIKFVTRDIFMMWIERNIPPIAGQISFICLLFKTMVCPINFNITMKLMAKF